MSYLPCMDPPIPAISTLFASGAKKVTSALPLSRMVTPGTLLKGTPLPLKPGEGMTTFEPAAGSMGLWEVGTVIPL